jgi:hypothetical protein
VRKFRARGPVTAGPFSCAANCQRPSYSCRMGLEGSIDQGAFCPIQRRPRWPRFAHPERGLSIVEGRPLAALFRRSGLGPPHYFTRVITLAPVTGGPSCVADASRRGRLSLGSLLRSSASGITIPRPSQFGHWFPVPGVSPVPSHQSHSIIDHCPVCVQPKGKLKLAAKN